MTTMKLTTYFSNGTETTPISLEDGFLDAVYNAPDSIALEKEVMPLVRAGKRSGVCLGIRWTVSIHTA